MLYLFKFQFSFKKPRIEYFFIHLLLKEISRSGHNGFSR